MSLQFDQPLDFIQIIYIYICVCVFSSLLSLQCQKHMGFLSLQYQGHIEFLSLQYPRHVGLLSLQCTRHIGLLSLLCTRHFLSGIKSILYIFWRLISFTFLFLIFVAASCSIKVLGTCPRQQLVPSSLMATVAVPYYFMYSKCTQEEEEEEVSR